MKFMQTDPEISIVVPVLNEEDTIKNVIDAIDSINLESYEIIIVDGGSVDGTVELVNQRNVKIIFQQKPGYIAALFEGTKHAKGNYIVWIDGDYSYNPRDIPLLLFFLKKEDIDHVIASRFDILPGLHSVNNFAYRLLNTMFSIITGYFYSDPLSTFRAIKKSILCDILKDTYYRRNLYFYNYYLMKKRYKLLEVPVSYFQKYDKTKLMTWKEGSKLLLSLLFLSFNKLLHKIKGENK